MMHEWPTENWPFSTCRRKTPLPEQQQGSSTGFLLHGSTRKWTFVCRLFCQWKCSATTNLDWLRSRLFLWYFGRDECCSGDTFLWVLCSPKANSLGLFSVLWLSTKPSNCLILQISENWTPQMKPCHGLLTAFVPSGVQFLVQFLPVWEQKGIQITTLQACLMLLWDYQMRHSVRLARFMRSDFSFLWATVFLSAPSFLIW